MVSDSFGPDARIVFHWQEITVIRAMSVILMIFLYQELTSQLDRHRRARIVKILRRSDNVRELSNAVS